MNIADLAKLLNQEARLGTISSVDVYGGNVSATINGIDYDNIAIDFEILSDKADDIGGNIVDTNGTKYKDTLNKHQYCILNQTKDAIFVFIDGVPTLCGFINPDGIFIAMNDMTFPYMGTDFVDDDTNGVDIFKNFNYFDRENKAISSELWDNKSHIERTSLGRNIEYDVSLNNLPPIGESEGSISDNVWNYVDECGWTITRGYSDAYQFYATDMPNKWSRNSPGWESYLKSFWWMRDYETVPNAGLRRDLEIFGVRPNINKIAGFGISIKNVNYIDYKYEPVVHKLTYTFNGFSYFNSLPTPFKLVKPVTEPLESGFIDMIPVAQPKENDLRELGSIFSFSYPDKFEIIRDRNIYKYDNNHKEFSTETVVAKSIIDVGESFLTNIKELSEVGKIGAVKYVPILPEYDVSANRFIDGVFRLHDSDLQGLCVGLAQLLHAILMYFVKDISKPFYPTFPNEGLTGFHSSYSIDTMKLYKEIFGTPRSLHDFIHKHCSKTKIANNTTVDFYFYSAYYKFDTEVRKYTRHQRFEDEDCHILYYLYPRFKISIENVDGQIFIQYDDCMITKRVAGFYYNDEIKRYNHSGLDFTEYRQSINDAHFYELDYIQNKYINGKIRVNDFFYYNKSDKSIIGAKGYKIYPDWYGQGGSLEVNLYGLIFNHIPFDELPEGFSEYIKFQSNRYFADEHLLKHSWFYNSSINIFYNPCYSHSELSSSGYNWGCASVFKWSPDKDLIVRHYNSASNYAILDGAGATLSNMVSSGGNLTGDGDYTIYFPPSNINVIGSYISSDTIYIAIVYSQSNNSWYLYASKTLSNITNLDSQLDALNIGSFIGTDYYSGIELIEFGDGSGTYRNRFVINGLEAKELDTKIYKGNKYGIDRLHICCDYMAKIGEPNIVINITDISFPMWLDAPEYVYKNDGDIMFPEIYMDLDRNFNDYWYHIDMYGNIAETVYKNMKKNMYIYLPKV